MHSSKNKIKAVMIGHAIGDALGVPVEFCTREELDKSPVTDMLGFGSHPVPAGAWSDDTGMSLATLDSLVKKGVDFNKIMENFVRWCWENEYTSTGETFDIGRTCLAAIRRYVSSDKKSPLECGGTDEYSNGNGSLMRIHPFVLYAHIKNMETDACIELVHAASALTHRHERSKVACGIYTFVLLNLLETPTKASLLHGLEQASKYYRNHSEFGHYKRLFGKHFDQTPRAMIKSSGYVVDTLEAAIWSVLNTADYESAVLKAVNLGEDTDTVAAIAGGLAGALYGYESIPPKWLNTLKRRDYIENLCEKVCE